MYMYVYVYVYVYVNVYVYLYMYMYMLTEFLPSSKTHSFFMGWGGVGWGGMLTFIGTSTHTRDATPLPVLLQLPHTRDATPLLVLLQLPHTRDATPLLVLLQLPHARDPTPLPLLLQLPHTHTRDATPLLVLLQLPHTRDATLGWGGVGWDVNVHWHFHTHVMLRHCSFFCKFHTRLATLGLLVYTYIYIYLFIYIYMYTIFLYLYTTVLIRLRASWRKKTAEDVSLEKLNPQVRRPLFLHPNWRFAMAKPWICANYADGKNSAGMYMYVYFCTCICICICICICKWICIRICRCICICKMCMYMYIYIYVYVYVYAYTYIYIYIWIYVISCVHGKILKCPGPLEVQPSHRVARELDSPVRLKSKGDYAVETDSDVPWSKGKRMMNQSSYWNDWEMAINPFIVFFMFFFSTHLFWPWHGWSQISWQCRDAESSWIQTGLRPRSRRQCTDATHFRTGFGEDEMWPMWPMWPFHQRSGRNKHLATGLVDEILRHFFGQESEKWKRKRSSPNLTTSGQQVTNHFHERSWM